MSVPYSSLRISGALFANALVNRSCFFRKSVTVLGRYGVSFVPTYNFHESSVRLLPKVVPYILSDIGEGIVDVVVKEWYVKPGDKVSQFDPVCEVQSDKASVTITSRFDGHVAKLHCEVDDVAKVGDPLLDILVPDDGPISPEVAAPAEETSTDATESSSVDEERYHRDKALATPAVRRIARENKINLSQVPATGKAGRVLKEDILSFMEQQSGASAGPPTSSSSVQTSVSASDTSQGDWTEDLSFVQKAMAKTMTEAWKIPHFGYSDEVDMTELVSFRSKARLDAKAGVKVTYLPFLLKAVSLALLRHPHLNAELDETCTKLTIHSDHNLGVAVDTPAGLLVPSVKKVQNLSIIQIAQELQRLQLLGKQGKLTRDDLSGGTLTLSNIGAIGGVHANPILLPPQIVIGAFGKIQRLPRYNSDGTLVPKDVMMVSWSADHRAVDGATIARFSNLFKLYLSTPSLLLQL